MDELLVPSVQKSLVCGKSSLGGTEEMFGSLGGLASSSEPMTGLLLFSVLWPQGTSFGQVTSQAFMKRDVVPGGPGRPAGPGCEGSSGRRRLNT